MSSRHACARRSFSTPSRARNSSLPAISKPPCWATRAIMTSVRLSASSASFSTEPSTSTADLLGGARAGGRQRPRWPRSSAASDEPPHARHRRADVAATRGGRVGVAHLRRALAVRGAGGAAVAKRQADAAAAERLAGRPAVGFAVVVRLAQRRAVPQHGRCRGEVGAPAGQVPDAVRAGLARVGEEPRAADRRRASRRPRRTAGRCDPRRARGSAVVRGVARVQAGAQLLRRRRRRREVAGRVHVARAVGVRVARGAAVGVGHLAVAALAADAHADRAEERPLVAVEHAALVVAVAADRAQLQRRLPGWGPGRSGRCRPGNRCRTGR